MRKSRGDARIVRGGALTSLAGFFILSALLRAGEVTAGLPVIDDGFGNPIAQTKTEKTPAPVAPAAAPAEAPSGVPEELIAELNRQRDAIRERETRIAEREQTLRALETRLKSRLEEVRSARDRLAETAALVDDAAGKDVRRLAQMYQQMKPKQAGQIFNQMDPTFAAGFLSEMRPDAAALVMANMDAPKAYAVSLLIAGRNVKNDAAARPDAGAQPAPPRE